MSLSRRKTIILNLRWHRRIGLAVIIMAIFLSVTGILLNHSPSFNLSKQKIQTEWLMNWYGFEKTQQLGFNIKGQWLNHSGNTELLLNTQPVAACQPPLLGGVQFNAFSIALCKDALIVLTSTGELVEKIDQLSGLPAGATALQTDGSTLYIQAHQQTLSLDIDTLKINPAQPLQQAWSTPSPLPASLSSQLKDNREMPGISLETLILDLHSGRFFGTLGVLFVDFIGLLFCILALTGFWAWYNHNKLRKSGG